MTPDSAAADVDVAQLYDGVNCARTAFARAASAVGVLEWVQIVAGEAVRFRFAGDALVDHLTPALEHHPVVDSSTEPLLTVHAPRCEGRVSCSGNAAWRAAGRTTG